RRKPVPGTLHRGRRSGQPVRRAVPSREEPGQRPAVAEEFSRLGRRLLIMALAKRIIPCLDCKNGRVVKGVQFVDIRDAGDPVEVSRRYCEQGADEITFLDITASSEERATTIQTVEAIAGQVFIPLTVGGGIRRLED